jgi:DNA polymerase III subunit gamma/tau
LKETWKTLSEKFVQEGKSGLSAHMKSIGNAVKINEDRLEITVNNSILAEQYNSSKGDIITTLRKKLFLESLELSVMVDEIKTERVAFTGKEKFEKMSKINPEILNLKNILGLEIEF